MPPGAVISGPPVTPNRLPPPAPGPVVIVATLVLLLVHVPVIPLASLSCDVAPTQIVVLPVIAAGNGFTVNKVETEHPVPSV